MPEPATDRLFSGNDLLAMGEVGPCELIDGRIVSMSPTGAEHGRIEGLVARKLGNYVEENALGWVLAGEVGIYTRRDPDRVRAADVVFVSKTQLPEIPDGFLEFAPELVVEVISPSDRWQDIRDKIDEYFSIGIQRVWIIEPKAHQILVYSSPTDAKRFRVGDTLRGELNLDGFDMAVDTVF